mmetsp:Transcript_30241/g.46270  ORF Transcript_30241/g.46270 Transcript_30241/m.46270 type:complete len:347 (-) Transcript_30241:152-1192(-)
MNPWIILPNLFALSSNMSSSNTQSKLKEVFNSEPPAFVPKSSSTATRILDCHNILGECILFDDMKNEVVWEDIDGKQLHILNLSTGRHTFHQFEKMLCAFALRPQGEDGYLFAWEDGFQLYDAHNNKALSAMSEGEDVNPKGLPTRLNDGRVDPTGKRFICGGYYGDVEENYMKVFKCEISADAAELKLKHEAVVEKIQVTNSMCWSLDGNTMYLADSPTSTIFKHDYDTEKGVLSNRRVVRKYEVGVPDGSCTDSQGNIWNAVWRNGVGQSMVRCINPKNGEILHTVELPDNTSQLTCCCFGGPDFDTLFISSAHVNRDRQKEPHAGSLYAVRVGIKGRLEKRFS